MGDATAVSPSARKNIVNASTQGYHVLHDANALIAKTTLHMDTKTMFQVVM